MVNTKQMIEEVRKIASENPEFVYGDAITSCSYFGRTIGDTSGQCCIIGQAFKNLGVNTEKLFSAEGRGDSPTFRMAVEEKLVDISVDHRRELNWLDSVQRGQDSGWSWSYALVVADKKFSVKP